MNILTLIGITNAYAAAATPATTQSSSQSLMSMLPLFLILILFMYFVTIRPQAKRAKEQKKLLSNLQKGDEVLTTSGLLGKIEKINNDFVILNIAENVNITIQKGAIVSCVPKGTIKSTEKENN